MSLKFKTQYLKQIRRRYFNSSKKQKSVILDELCEVTGFHRKYAIKILSRGHNKGPKASGRTKVYSDMTIFHLKKLWHLMGRMCSKKMVSAFPILNGYEHYLIHDRTFESSRALIKVYTNLLFAILLV